MGGVNMAINTITVNRSTPIRASSAPNLPIAPTEYLQSYQDQLNNAMRLYFAQIDNFNQALVTTVGGSSLSFPYVQLIDTVSQYTTANTPTAVNWTGTTANNTFTLSNNIITVQQSGNYKFTYTLQATNNDILPHNIVVWVRVNNTDITNSANIYTVPASGSTPVVSSNLMYITAGGVISLVWGASQAANLSGTIKGIYLQAQAAQTSPMAYPASPSSIGLISFVSAS
jgi:hypothetical protein